MTYNSQINLAERANNQQKMQASHSYVEQNANFLPLNFYVVQMLNTQLASFDILKFSLVARPRGHK